MLPTECRYTNDWYRKQFALQSRENNSLKAETVDMIQQVRLLRKELDAAKQDRANDSAKIGELISLVELLRKQSDETVKRLDKASEVVTNIRRDLKAVPSLSPHG